MTETETTINGAETSNSNWETLNTQKPFHDFNKNPVVVGRIEKAFQINTKYGLQNCIIILDETISLSNVQLNGLQDYVGRFVRIEYLGEEINQKTGNRYKKYDVRIRKEKSM